MKEKLLVFKIRKHLETKYGALVIKHTGSIFAQAGVADLLCCISSRFIAIELKVGRNTTTPLQDHFLRRVRQAGGIAFVVRKVEEIDALLGWLLIDKNLSTAPKKKDNGKIKLIHKGQK